MSQIMGSPTALKVGRGTLLVSYVSMREWQTFGEMLKFNEPRALRELIYYSLCRANPAMTRCGARRWIFWHRKALGPLTELICKISLPKMSESITPIVAAKEVERNEKTMYRLLSKMYGWTPEEIGNMSPAQLYSYQMGGKDGTGIEKMTGAEYRSFRARRGMSVGGLN